MHNKIKQENPLVLNITNYVTMDFVANGLLSLGASPIMSKSIDEIENLLQLTQSVVINLGTLNAEFIKLCQHTCKIANQLNLPVVLDPVGAGASQLRTKTSLSLMNDYKISIIRGNASEIMALSDFSHKTKGVDSRIQTEDVIEQAKLISKHYDSALIVSGKVDLVIDQDLMSELHCGSDLMPMITGTGCLHTAVIAAFHAIHKNRFEAAKAATLFYGHCGEKAAQNAKGPGTFRSQFLDALYEKN